jgi:hypothetical protein
MLLHCYIITHVHTNIMFLCVGRLNKQKIPENVLPCYNVVMKAMSDEVGKQRIFPLGRGGVRGGGSLAMDCIDYTFAAFALNDTFATALERYEPYLLSYVSNFLSSLMASSYLKFDSKYFESPRQADSQIRVFLLSGGR